MPGTVSRKFHKARTNQEANQEKQIRTKPIYKKIDLPY